MGKNKIDMLKKIKIQKIIILILFIFLFCINIYAEKKATESDITKTIYLTFDDGPSDITLKILDVLDEYDAKATFFMVGINLQNHEGIAKKVLQKGHSIGIHSYLHKREEIYKDQYFFQYDVEKAELVFNNILGIKPKFYRFPGGTSSKLAKAYGGEMLMPTIIQIIHNKGYKIFDWNVDSGDGTNKTTNEEIVKNVLEGIEKINLPVVLMHDSLYKKNNPENLKKILEEGKKRGYSFEKLTDGVKEVMHYKY